MLRSLSVKDLSESIPLRLRPFTHLLRLLPSPSNQKRIALFKMAYFQGTAPPPHPFVLHSPSSSLGSPSKSKSLDVPDPTSRVSPTEAAALVSTFLKRSTVDPAYRPDSILSARGPQATSTSVANPNLTLHNLEKVRDGMLGKKAKRGDTDAKLGFFGQHNQATATATPSHKRKAKDDPENVGVDKGKRRKGEGEKKSGNEMTLAGPPQVAGAAGGNEDEGWQDLESFEREQDVEEGELGDRDLDPGDERAEPEEVAVAVPMDVDETSGGALKKKKKDKNDKKDRKVKHQEPETESAETKSQAQAMSKSKMEKDNRKNSKKERRKEEKREREQARIAAKAGEEKEEEGKRKDKRKKSKP